MLLAILVLRQKKKNAHIVLDSQNNATLVPENAVFHLKQNVQTRGHVTRLFVVRIAVSSRLTLSTG